MEGWIKLHRKLLEWEWYDEPNTFRLFMHCLLKANHKDNNYRGQLVKAGSFLTSRDLLAKETGLSTQQVRTSLKRLESTNEITTKKSKKGTVLQVVKYVEYQLVNQQTNQKLTNNQPTDNQQLTTNNNDNNDNNEKKLNIDASQIKKLEVDLMSEVQQKNIIQKAQYKVEERNGKWVCDYNFNPYSQLRKKFNSFQFICKRFKWKFNDVNHVKNSFFNFVVKYWEFNTDTIESKLKQEYKTKFAK